jgi:GT2 family glycosyltransferase
MKKIAIFCVSYHSDKERDTYLVSIETAAKKAENIVSVEVYVANNTQKDNPGYFGAIRRLMKQVDVTDYDYSIISNVDLTIPEDFFVKLANYDCKANDGWIAPQIWSAQENRDMNPKIKERYSFCKLKTLQFLHRHHFLHSLYSKTFYKRERPQSANDGIIYAGHGSFIILTKEYFKRCGIINYPVFLFCEEIYLGEMCRQNHLQVVHVPLLKIFDNEHISTSRMPVKKYSRLNYEAVSYILQRFYSQN